MNIIGEIKDIIFKFIETQYKDYLKDQEILFIKENELKMTLNDFYDKNSHEIKKLIRTTLKEKHKENYPNASVENIIYDIFHEKESNLQTIIEEISFIQNSNYKAIQIPIINNSINLNISIVDNFIVINSYNKKNIITEDHINLYDIVNTYKFIYAIDHIILHEYDNTEKIDIIKKTIENKDVIHLELYFFKKNCE